MAAPYRWLDVFVDQGWLGILGPSELCVLLAIGRNCNLNTQMAWPRIETLMARCKLAESSVYNALAGLKRYGLIDTAVIERQGKRRRYYVEAHRLVGEIPNPPTPQDIRQTPEDGGVSEIPDSHSGLENGANPDGESVSPSVTVHSTRTVQHETVQMDGPHRRAAQVVANIADLARKKSSW